MHEGGNRPARPANFFLGGASVKLSVMLLHRHRAIIWYTFGVACLNSMEVGLFLRLCFVLECGLLLSVCTEADPCLSKLSVPLK